MAIRRSARWLLVNPQNEVLLFRFVLPHETLWATPGGKIESGESVEHAARRELAEETGICLDDAGRCIAKRRYRLPVHGGAGVMAHEYFFRLRVEQDMIQTGGWTASEHAVISGWRWWPVDDIVSADDVIFPRNIAEMLSLPESGPPAFYGY